MEIESPTHRLDTIFYRRSSPESMFGAIFPVEKSPIGEREGGRGKVRETHTHRRTTDKLEISRDRRCIFFFFFFQDEPLVKTTETPRR